MTKSYIISKATTLCHENFSAYEAAVTFDINYSNMCAYLRGSKQMPLDLAFEILDYLGAKLVIFRGK